MRGNASKVDEQGKLRNGAAKFFFKDGTLESAGDFLDGEKQGEWKYYLKNGNLKAIGKYEAGQLSGEWKWYRENGNLMQPDHLKRAFRSGFGSVFTRMDPSMTKASTRTVRKLANGRFSTTKGSL